MTIESIERTTPTALLPASHHLSTTSRWGVDPCLSAARPVGKAKSGTLPADHAAAPLAATLAAHAADLQHPSDLGFCIACSTCSICSIAGAAAQPTLGGCAAQHAAAVASTSMTKKKEDPRRGAW